MQTAALTAHVNLVLESCSFNHVYFKVQRSGFAWMDAQWPRHAIALLLPCRRPPRHTSLRRTSPRRPTERRCYCSHCTAQCKRDVPRYRWPLLRAGLRACKIFHSVFVDFKKNTRYITVGGLMVYVICKPLRSSGST